MILTGKRYIKKKRTNDVTIVDWLLTISMFVFGFAFIVLGINGIIKNNFFGIVLIVFGTIGLMFVYIDYINFKGKSRIKNYWLTTHLQRMIGSFIAAFTAFVVVNNKFLPDIVAWLLPTFILVPFIVIWSRKYKVKIDKNITNTGKSTA
jgi:succinate-acetate transporter protein